MKQAPRLAETPAEIAALDRDNIDIGIYWMVMGEGTVSIARQVPGQPAEKVLTIPRPIFNQFIDWYNTGIEPKGEDDGKRIS